MYIDNMKKDEYSRDVLEKAIVKVVGVTVKNPTLIKEVNNSIITKIIFDKNPVESIITSISKK